MKFPNVCVWCGRDGAAKAYCEGNGVKRFYHRACRRKRCEKVRSERVSKREEKTR